MKPIAPLLLASALISALPVAHADVLLMDVINQAPVNSAEGLPRPSGGETMDQIRNRYGSPANEIPQIGDPPISRWVYDSFTVYFEFDRVITSVVHR